MQRAMPFTSMLKGPDHMPLVWPGSWEPVYTWLLRVSHRPSSPNPNLDLQPQFRVSPQSVPGEVAAWAGEALPH